MNDPVYQRLLETSWRRELTPAEQAELEARLADRPEARAAWETDAALSRLLRRLPDASPSSNFTAQVLRAVEVEAASRRSHARWWESWFRPVWPRLAWGVAVLALAAVAVHHHRQTSRARLARELARMSVVVSLPSVEVFQDFEPIRRLSHVPAASDEDLLAALQ